MPDPDPLPIDDDPPAELDPLGSNQGTLPEGAPDEDG